MMVGLNGAGKTTTTAKLARYLRDERGRRPYLVPADVYRPAAIEQLAHPRPPDRGSRARGVARRRSRRDRAQRGGGRPRAGRRHGAHRHRRPSDRRRRADGRARAHARRRRAATDPARRRRHDRPGRRRDGAGLPGAPAAVGRRPHARSRATRAAAPRCRCAPSPASPSSSWAPARSSTPSRRSTPTASPRASSAWATCCRSSSAPRSAYDRTKAVELQKKLKKNEFDLEDFRDQLRAVRRWAR